MDVQILPASVVTITVSVLHEYRCVRAIFLIEQRVVRLRAAAVSEVLYLLDRVHFVEQAIRRVSSSARFFRIVVFRDRFKVDDYLRREARASHLPICLQCFQVSVSIVIVHQPVAILARSVWAYALIVHRR